MTPEERRRRIGRLLERPPAPWFEVDFNKVRRKNAEFNAAQEYQNLKLAVTRAGGDIPQDVHFDDRRRTFTSRRSPQLMLETARPAILPLKNAATALNPMVGGASVTVIETVFATRAAVDHGKKLRGLIDDEVKYQAGGYDFNGYDRLFPDRRLTGIADSLRGKNAGEALTTLLADVKTPGVLLGESHGDPDAWEALSANLPELRNARVSTIYLEALRHTDTQHELNAFFDRPDSELPDHPNLAKCIGAYDDAHNGGRPLLADLVSGARDHGIRVVAIDDKVARREIPKVEEDEDWEMEQRAARMNTVAASIIKTHQATPEAQDGRYVVLVGENHCNTQKFTRGPTRGDSSLGQPGMAQLLRVVAAKCESNGTVTLLPEDKTNRMTLLPGPPEVDVRLREAHPRQVVEQPDAPTTSERLAAVKDQLADMTLNAERPSEGSPAMRRGLSALKPAISRLLHRREEPAKSRVHDVEHTSSRQLGGRKL